MMAASARLNNGKDRFAKITGQAKDQVLASSGRILLLKR